jgi:hypothetical protein
VLQLVPDELTRSHYAQLVARRLDYPFKQVQARLQSHRPAAARRTTAGAETASRATAPSIEDHLIALLLKYRPIAFELMSEVPPDDIFDARNRYLLGVARDETLPDDFFTFGFEETLETPMAEHALALLGTLENRPSQLPGEIQVEVLQTLMRLERERYETLSAHLRSEIAAAETARDAELLPTLLAQYDRLSTLHKRTYPPLSPYFRDSRTRGPSKKPSSFPR